MSQQSVVEYLKKSRKPKTCREISEAINVSSAGMSLQKLRKQGVIKFEKIQGKGGGRHYLYWIKK